MNMMRFIIFRLRGRDEFHLLLDRGESDKNSKNSKVYIVPNLTYYLPAFVFLSYQKTIKSFLSE